MILQTVIWYRFIHCWTYSMFNGYSVQSQTPTYHAQTSTPVAQTSTYLVLRPVQAWAFHNCLGNVKQSNGSQFHDCQWPNTYLYTLGGQENIVSKFSQFLLAKYIGSYGEGSNPSPLWFIAAPYWHAEVQILSRPIFPLFLVPIRALSSIQILIAW